MGYKRPPTEDELNALADQFRALWTPGTPIRTWLRKHAAQIQAARGEWSWAAIAAALDRAGIGYQPRIRANPAARDPEWSPDTLKQEFSRARKPLKGYVRKKEPAPKVEPQPEPLAESNFIRQAEKQAERSETLARLTAAALRPAEVDLRPVTGPLQEVLSGVEVLAAEVRMLSRKTAVAAPPTATVVEYRYTDPPPVTATLSKAEKETLSDVRSAILQLTRQKTLTEIEAEKRGRKDARGNMMLAAFAGLIVGIVGTVYISLHGYFGL